MVRIVNGVIVSDDAPVRMTTTTNQATVSNINVFPSTNNYFGKLSDTVSFLGYSSEIIWLLVLFMSGSLFGAKNMLIIAFMLWIYQRNFNNSEKGKSNINSFARSY